jgi:hypothetical protein
MEPVAADAFNNTHITNNYILVARDLAGSLKRRHRQLPEHRHSLLGRHQPADLRQQSSCMAMA